MEKILYKVPSERVVEGFRAAEERLRKALAEHNLTRVYAIALDMKKYFEAFNLRNSVVEAIFNESREEN